MSRVFDALTRAKEEKKPAAAESAHTEWVLEEGTAARERSRRPSNGDSGAASFLAHFDPWPKSWRERLEEMLFGRDLKRYKNYPIVALEKSSQAAEQYKILRQQIKRFRNESGAQTLAITSPARRDGKTVVSVNLAVALSLEYDEKVLLIDGDLRSPQVHRYFGIHPRVGLTDYLHSTSNGNLTEYVHDTFLPSLRILPAGKPSDVSSELLATERMRSLMDEIRAKFPDHQIIVDTPPVLSTPDPLVLAAQVDGIIIVMRARKTPRNYLLKAVQSLNSSKVIGVVLNGVELGVDSHYYSHRTKET